MDEVNEAAEEAANGPEWEMRQIFEANQSIIKQAILVKRIADDLKDAKGELQDRRDHLTTLISAIEQRRAAEVPDPGRYPLYDRPATGDEARELVAGMFPKPEAIQPIGGPVTGTAVGDDGDGDEEGGSHAAS